MSTEIIEGNKLIAEFMGYKFNSYPELKHNNITKPNEHEWYFASWDLEDVNRVLEKEMPYHTSFYWLMPVVEKIAKDYTVNIHSYPGQEISVTIKEGNYRRGYGESMDFINAIWLAVIDFIKWYNQALQHAPTNTK